MAREEAVPAETKPFPRFGLWHPRLGITDALPPSPHPNVPILFYRAALEGAGTATLEALIAELEGQRLTPVPLVISTLKEGACLRFVQRAFAEYPPAVILNLTGFALGLDGLDPAQNPFAGTDAPVIQLIQSGRPEAQWSADPQGLTAKDLAMQVVLPELDGRHGMLLVGHKQEAVWHERTQCPLSAYAPDHDGIRRAVTLAQNWATLRATPRADRRVAIVLANYPIRDGRLANGVGYDAPQSTVEILKTLKQAGYDLAAPSPSPLVGEGARRADEGWSPPALPQTATPSSKPCSPAPPTPTPSAVKASRSPSPATANSSRTPGQGAGRSHRPLGRPLNRPLRPRRNLPPPGPPLRQRRVLLQPARGYDLDETAAYHDPDLVPPHGYLAAYLWLRHEFAAHAVIHNGKHGNLEWLPGKATALDPASYPAALWAELPQLYPFIVNDPGEGTQAKRRTGAVIIDHLVPPLTRAETYGPLKDLEALLDEYYAASGMDRRRLAGLRKRILDFARDTRLDRDIGLVPDETESLRRIDTFLCDLKEAQIRDGLHIFGQSPTGRLERDLTVALARVPRGETPAEASLIRALADDLKLAFDPLTADLGAPWTGPAYLPTS
jgi:cobaltochelatase CobN